MKKMDGRNLIGYNYSALADEIMEVLNPALKETLEGQFHIATIEETDNAMQLATEAFNSYKKTSGVQRANFLNAIADEIMNLGDGLIQRAMEESGLPEGRIIGERGRTVNQMRLFAKVAEEGSWVEATIDFAQADRQPIPKPDIRKMLVPIGPIVVFTASNFPLAFSTAGGDTASALASGNPVIVKAHESHLGTNALVAFAIQQAAQKTGMPNGVFSSLNGTGPDLGQRLAKHPLTKAVAFTGSFGAGKALFDTAVQREEPIPVFAEMGSVNPVLLCKEALKIRGAAIAKQYAGSVTLGTGQFCTNPGLLIGKEGPELDYFIKELSNNINDIAPSIMLNEGICKNYDRNKDHILNQTGVNLEGESNTAPQRNEGRPAVASVSGSAFIENPALDEEVFGPFTLVVKCESDEILASVVKSLKGQLTATIMAEESELKRYESLINNLQDRVGRILFNGVPTGVEVCHAMQHGGPFPATTDSRFTSVGTAAIKRFARPLAFQSWPKELLPNELKDGNPLEIWRTEDGEFKK
jgi:NADP-dependent aldehyde dehydrogenase